MNKENFKKLCELLNITEKDEKENLIDLLRTKNDFYFEPESGGEYRVIDENYINDIHHEENLELIKDCYLDGKDLPWWIEIDWKKTTQNVRDSDGYGHHFSAYDGCEEYIDGFYIFRTN